jgi:isochorismate synthase/2-succinyl-5-enolpyruvyl-6-hydroxy-3-cyclohexene-1-carboxylate synthase/2-succinyl-6-hydroxy-2,4-cyclohexadiene-1-carboxylate synthase/O-succinylbenzoate synthase
VQHLYARLGCELRDGTTEADLLSALHPTPAVCGHPRKLALSAIRQNEPFDRGLYAGPLGWIGADSAEFCVAIRSALVEHTGDDDDNTDTGPGVCPGSDSSGTTASTASSTTTTTDTTATRATSANTTKKHLPIKTVMRLYAGVGVVAAADSNAEWRELNLKTKPLESLVGSLDGVVTELTKGPSGTQRKHPSGIEPKTTGGTSRLATSLNPNQAWADLLIGELWRNGVSVFCVAPGSRSTPLALAAEKHPCARVVVCVDERSLAFYALGVGKGAGSSSAGACVITSSGTAVANLLPAAVEASASNAPLLLLTADRPPELRDTGANQTIDQVKIFGSFTRYSVDLAPPGDGSPARVWVRIARFTKIRGHAVLSLTLVIVCPYIAIYSSCEGRVTVARTRPDEGTATSALTVCPYIAIHNTDRHTFLFNRRPPPRTPRRGT